jgi:hypothetical protein
MLNLSLRDAHPPIQIRPASSQIGWFIEEQPKAALLTALDTPVNTRTKPRPRCLLSTWQYQHTRRAGQRGASLTVTLVT